MSDESRISMVGGEVVRDVRDVEALSGKMRRCEQESRRPSGSPKAVAASCCPRMEADNRIHLLS